MDFFILFRLDGLYSDLYLTFFAFYNDILYTQIYLFVDITLLCQGREYVVDCTELAYLPYNYITLF